jgi:hypothetical protein
MANRNTPGSPPWTAVRKNRQNLENKFRFVSDLLIVFRVKWMLDLT